MCVCRMHAQQAAKTTLRALPCCRAIHTRIDTLNGFAAKEEYIYMLDANGSRRSSAVVARHHADSAGSAAPAATACALRSNHFPCSVWHCVSQRTWRAHSDAVPALEADARSAHTNTQKSTVMQTKTQMQSAYFARPPCQMRQHRMHICVVWGFRGQTLALN